MTSKISVVVCSLSLMKRVEYLLDFLDELECVKKSGYFGLNSSEETFSELDRYHAAILLHSPACGGRLALTDVPDGRYDNILLRLRQQFGKY